MERLLKEAPNVGDAFFKLTGAITDYFSGDLKTKEIILIGVYTAEGAVRGLKTHVKRAIDNKATKKEILGSILLALPVVGISKVNRAIEVALQVIDENS